MGLDQFAYKTTVKPSREIDFNAEVYKDEVVCEEIHYWRKHPNIHGFMESLYHKKGGEETFNCKTVQLTQDDIDCLVEHILDDMLPKTTGFFFGQSDGTEENEDLEFCKKASDAIKEGYIIFYDSWW